jgi:hypothetical protein
MQRRPVSYGKNSRIKEDMFALPIRAALAASVLAVVLSASSTKAKAVSVILDGTFQNQIGTGSSQQPWSDWGNAGIKRSAAPSGIAGNYASLPIRGNLFQEYAAPVPGQYLLSFSARNESNKPAKLVVGIQPVGGDTPPYRNLEFWLVLDLKASQPFTFYSYGVQLKFPAGTMRQLFFANSYNAPVAALGLQHSINPPGTVIDVAGVSLNSVVPEPHTPTNAGRTEDSSPKIAMPSDGPGLTTLIDIMKDNARNNLNELSLNNIWTVRFSENMNNNCQFDVVVDKNKDAIRKLWNGDVDANDVVYVALTADFSTVSAKSVSVHESDNIFELSVLAGGTRNDSPIPIYPIAWTLRTADGRTISAPKIGTDIPPPIGDILNLRSRKSFSFQVNQSMKSTLIGAMKKVVANCYSR